MVVTYLLKRIAARPLKQVCPNQIPRSLLVKIKFSNTIFLLTFGEHGSVAYHRGRVFEQPAITVDQVIDTTGCGDCYQGHFVAEYLRSSDIAQAMQKASIEAAKVTGYVGGFATR